MIWPNAALVIAAPSADLRATPDDHAELVDQSHWMERVRVLAQRDSWRYVQTEDHYFGWIRSELITELAVYGKGRAVRVTVAPVLAERDITGEVIASLPAGSQLPEVRAAVYEGSLTREIRPPEAGPWIEVQITDRLNGARRTGWVATDDTVAVAEMPHRYPTADDLLATAEAFLGVPYMWGGTTALGIDCSGFVQQVYRLNGIRLDRDAHQQAMEGRSVDVPAAGDLIFFGGERVTHVGLAVNEHTFINAPQAGTKVRYDELPAGRNVLAIRRYLP